MDISESREQELADLLVKRTQELAFAQAQIEALFANSPLAIGTASMDEKILSANAAMARMFGYSENELIGTKVTSFFVDSEQRKGLIQRLRTDKVIQSQRQQLRRKDGTLFYANVTESILERENQTVIIGIVDDITNQITAEQMVREKAEVEAIASERNRIARELHDSVTQSLYSANLFAEAGRETVEAGDIEGAVHYFRRIGQTTQQALKEMRLFLYELRPPDVVEEGLVNALQKRLEAVEMRSGMEARLILEGSVDFPEKISDQIYRIAQEALNNIVKHAQAENVTVYLRAKSGTMGLEIVDDGRGFHLAEAESSGGMGLQTMRERASRIGGRLSIDTAPGQGTAVKVEVEKNDT